MSSQAQFQQFGPFFDGGVVVTGAKLYACAAGTTTQKTVWYDQAMTTTAPFPMVANANGLIVGFFDGLYKIVIARASSTGPADGVLEVWDNYNVFAELAIVPGVINVQDDAYGALGDGSTDDTAAILAAFAAVTNGGIVYFPAGRYFATSPLTLEDNIAGVTLLGAGVWDATTTSGTTLYGAHTGKAVLSIVGSEGVKIQGITVQGDSGSRPKTGLLLGRSSASSAGNHTIEIAVTGYYSLAGIYNVASEGNTWINPLTAPQAAPYAAFYISETDALAVGGLTASTMTQETILGGDIQNYDDTAGSAAIYIKGGTNLGHLKFLNTFLAKSGGDSFITIDLSASLVRPIQFENVVGEHTGAIRPTSGIHVTGAAGAGLFGFTADSIGLDGETNCILVDPGMGEFVRARIYWFPVRDGMTMSLIGATHSDFTFLNNGPMLFPNGLVSSRLLHNYASGPTITGTRAGSTVWFTDGIDGRLHLPVIAAGSIPAAAALENGSILIEDNGAGDRNIIIYAGSQRFRIDGGAAF